MLDTPVKREKYKRPWTEAVVVTTGNKEKSKKPGTREVFDTPVERENNK